MDSSPRTVEHISTLTTVSTTATLATSPSESPSDSFSELVNNLFPTESVKSDCVAQGFTGLESPPIVFSSVNLNANIESNLLKRTHYDQSSFTKLVAESQEYDKKVSEQTVRGLIEPLSFAQPNKCLHYLQFKDVSANAPPNNFLSSNYLSFVEDTELSLLNFDPVFNNRVSVNSSHSLHTLLHPDSSGNPPLGVSKPSGIGLHLNSITAMKNHETPYETSNFDLDQFFNHEKINNLLSKRKRKSNSVNNSRDGSKGCNCQKTKCLKLYCDCFAAGIYCLESCSCQGCFNNPENVQTVLQTRHEIEFRDPHAFEPKKNGRHKKGCKCKKSMCSKQYCECFQANVGCTVRCQCKDCRNVHGKKEEHSSGRADVRRFGDRLIADHDVTVLRKDFLNSEFYGQQHNFVPQTPSFQYSDQEKDSPKPRLMSRRCLPSPEFGPTSSSSPHCSDIFIETKTNILDVDSYRWQQMNCDNVGTSSTSFIPSKPRGCLNVSRIGQPGIGSSSTFWRRSPDTPLIQAGETETSIKCINGSSPKKMPVLPPQSSENEVGMNNSLGRLKSRRYILKSMPPFLPLTPRDE